MDINEKGYLLGICFWLEKQPEAKEFDKTDERSLFYHTAPLTFAKLILRYVREQNADTSDGQLTIPAVSNPLSCIGCKYNNTTNDELCETCGDTYKNKAT
jgi:hypothetical protein